MSAPAARPGDAVAGIDTPALVIDLDALDRNIERMAAFAREHGLLLRPHAKTHKSAQITKRQTAAGAVGVCVQKLSEAQVLVDAGVESIFISNEIVSARKLADLVVLAGRARLSVAVDSTLGIERLAQACAAHGAPVDIGVFVEVDVGQGRCGVPPA